MDGIANAVKVQANSSGSTIQIGNGTVYGIYKKILRYRIK